MPDITAAPVEEQTRGQKIAKWGVYIALALIALGVGVLLFWAFQSNKVIKVNNEPFPVRTIREHPTANGVVILKLDFCKLQDVEGDLRISFINQSNEIFLPLTRERAEPGCKITEFPIIIPSNVQPGEYRVKFRIFYDINPLKQQVQNEFTSQPFIIDATIANPATGR